MARGLVCSRACEPGVGVVGRAMAEDEQGEPGRPSRLLDMSGVRLNELADFKHPRLVKAQRDLVEVVEARQVVAGFGSAI
jgi:hypothetical protein